MRGRGLDYGGLRRKSTPAPAVAIARKTKGTETSAPERRAGQSNYEMEARRGVAGAGRPLEASTKEFMGSRFGHDFSNVRVHTDSAAARAASRLEARAFTTGHQIAFGATEYAPQRAGGQHLLAHELAHVVQNDRGGRPTQGVSRPGDQAEVAADRAVAGLFLGKDGVGDAVKGSGVAVARQPTAAPLAPTTAPLPSQGESVVAGFLLKMWAKQSDETGEFRVTAKVLEGLNLIFPFGAQVGPITTFPSTDALMARLRPSIPATVDPNTLKRLDRIPSEEKKLSDAAKKDPKADPAEAKFPEGYGPPKPPDAPKGYDDAAAAALQQAYDLFSKTELGKQLEKSLKEYALSVDGIPFDVLVVGGVLTFVAVDNPKLPSSPPIPLADGVKLKIDISGKVGDFPPLLQDLVRGHSTQPNLPGKTETKLGLTVTLTDDAAVAMAKAVGHFFAEAARWFAKGVIHIGSVIQRAGIHIGRALLAGAGGAALGAIIGGLAGGGVGALIGAGVGAVVGLGASLIGDVVSNKKKKVQTT
jgi:hypothetical protein